MSTRLCCEFCSHLFNVIATGQRISCPSCGAIQPPVAPAPPKPAAPVPAPGKAAAPPPAALPRTVTQAAAPPTLVAGHEMVREIARGGLGVVYLARHPFLNDFRAIKRPLSPDGPDRDMLLARFRREVQAVGSLHNPHVIRAHDAGTDADGPFLVMEYVDGEPLSRLAERRSPLPVPEACELVRQVALGLQAAHERGLVHRDVKPSNLMLARGTPHPRVVVIDWGLVKFANESGPGNPPPDDARTRAGVSMGTPDYISPEQVADTRSADIRTDIYSLGTTLYRLLAGFAPFQGRSELEKLLAHQREAFPPLERVRPDTPAALLGVIQKMGEKDPARRSATPGEVARVLQPFACGPDSPSLAALFGPAPIETRAAFQNPTVMGVSPPPSAPPYYAAPAPVDTPPVKRNRRVLMIGAAVVVLLAVGILLAMKMGGKKGTEGEPAKGGEAQPGGDNAKAVGSRTPIDEDFRTAFDKKDLPDGWKGEGFRVVKDGGTARNPGPGDPCLQVSKATGDHFVTLPPVALAGDFAIEAAYFLDAYQHLIVRLDARKSNSLFTVSVDWTGKVLIADEPFFAPSNYKPYLPTKLLVKREGKRMRVFINGEPVGDKTLDAATEYESIQLGMTAGSGYVGRWASLYRFKVALVP